MPVRRQVCSLLPVLQSCCSKLVVFESRLRGGKLVVLLPVWLCACCFVLRLWGGKLVVFYYACVSAEKKKTKKQKNKERRRSFVACVAVSLKLVVLCYACGAVSL